MRQDNELELINSIKEQQAVEDKFNKKKKLDKDFQEATRSETFTVLNTVVSVVTAILSLAFVSYFLWNNSKVLLVILIVLIISSFVFRYLAKRNFAKDNKKKFETYNKLSSITGIATSAFELTDSKKNRSKGAIDKVDNVESSINNMINTVAETQFKCGTYSVKKYDDIRSRAIGTGKYIYLNKSSNKLVDLLMSFKQLCSKSKLSKDSNFKVKLLSAYVNDYTSKTYPNASEELFYACLGSIYYFVNPLTDLPDNVPFVGYKDNTFVAYCVYAKYYEDLDKYKKWKLDTYKANNVDKAMKNIDNIWKSLYKRGKETTLSVTDIYNLTSKKIKEKDTDSNILDNMKALNDIVFNYNKGHYHLQEYQFLGILGTLLLFIQHNADDVICINDKAYDCSTILYSVFRHLNSIIKDFNTWKGLSDLTDENDPLVEYLNTVIGEDVTARNDEIERLSKLCPDKKVKDVKDRARITIKHMF